MFTIKWLNYLLFTSFFLTGMFSQPIVNRTGKDKAIFFAVSTYEDAGWKDLSNPVKEAEQLSQKLQKDFGFETEVIKNPSKTQIIRKLKALQQESFNKEDQLLLFFTGHGLLSGNEGFFITREINELDADIDALDYTRLKKLVNDISCQHTLLMIDACHSGALFIDNKSPKWTAEIDKETQIAESKLKERIFRLGITSGAADKQTPNKSSFAKAFYEGLLKASESGKSLTSIGAIWRNKMDQKILPKPEIGMISNEHNTDSDFYFFLQKEKEKPVEKEKKTLEIKSTEQLQAEVNLVNHWEQTQLYINGQFNGTLESGRRYNFNLGLGYYQFQLKKDGEVKWQSKKFYLTQAGKSVETSIPPPPKEMELEEVKKQGDDANKVEVSALFPEMVKVAGGTFTMGCTTEQGNECDDDEKPAHQVTLSTYYIGKYEITREQFCVFLNEKGNQVDHGVEWVDTTRLSSIEFKDGRYVPRRSKLSYYVPKKAKINYPVSGVTWYGAKAYCDWLAEKTGKNYRLPTEAEWEFAARGGNQSRGHKYPGTTTELGDYAWYNANSDYRRYAVGQKKANELGLHDMSGNVKEWCYDYYGDYPAHSPANPQGPNTGPGRILRGNSSAGRAEDMRVSDRLWNQSTFRHMGVGFRVVIVP